MRNKYYFATGNIWAILVGIVDYLSHAHMGVQVYTRAHVHTGVGIYGHP
jgi:hypothetical protein